VNGKPPHIHPLHAHPRRHAPRAAAPLDTDGYTLVQSRRQRRGRRNARLTLVATGQCRLRSSVSASTVWRGTTSPLGSPRRPAASSATTRGTGRETASTNIVVRPGASIHRSPLSVVFSDVLLEATTIVLIRTRASSTPVAMASTMAAVARVLLVRWSRTRLLSLSVRFFARPLRRQRWRVAARSHLHMRHIVARTEPRREPMASIVDADGARESYRGRSMLPPLQTRSRLR